MAMPAAADAPPPTVIVVDSSNSMAAALNGEPRLDTARTVLNKLIAGWQPDAPLGLIAYGHRRAGDCKDIEVLAPIGPVDAPALAARLKALRAKGKTPLSASIERAAELLADAPQGGRIILVTDGIETCRADPCAVAEKLRAANAKLAIHVIGFAVDAKDEEQLSCIARAGGGEYRTAGDAESLQSGISEAAGEAAAPAPVEPPPAPPPQEPPPAPPPPPPPPSPVLIGFKAVVEGEGPLVDMPAAWRITGSGEKPFTYEGASRGLSLELLPGPYAVEARASNVVGTAQAEIAAGETQTVEVILPAARLSARAVPYRGAPVLDDKAGVVWTLSPTDGQPQPDEPRVARPAWLLAYGGYRLAATYQGQRAEAAVTIARGAPQEIELSFRLGQLRLLAATSAEAEPLTNWRDLKWRVLAADGTEATKALTEAQPLLELQAGSYTAELGIAGTKISQAVTVDEGKLKEERLIVPTGKRLFSAALSEGSEPFTDWRDGNWTITPVEAVGMEAGKPIMEVQPSAGPEVDLMPGRWSVTVKSGLATASTEITVGPETSESVRINLNAARLTIVAAPEDGTEPMNIVFEVAPVAADGSAGDRIALGGTHRSIGTILPAGRWRVFTVDSDNRQATGEVDLAAGETRDLALTLR